MNPAKYRSTRDGEVRVLEHCVNGHPYCPDCEELYIEHGIGPEVPVCLRPCDEPGCRTHYCPERGTACREWVAVNEELPLGFNPNEVDFTVALGMGGILLGLCYRDPARSNVLYRLNVAEALTVAAQLAEAAEEFTGEAATH
jgi:hypothetical protein